MRKPTPSALTGAAPQRPRAAPVDAPVSGIARGILGAMAWALAWLALYRFRAESRRRLAALNERQLKDVGLTRADVAHEAAKPFWRR